MAEHLEVPAFSQRLRTGNHWRNQKRHVNVQGVRKALKVVDGDVSLFPLDSPYKRPMKPGSFSKLLLRDAAFRANDT